MTQSGFFPKSDGGKDEVTREIEAHEDSYVVDTHESDVRGFDCPDAPGKSRIEKFRAIVKAKAVMCIEGQPVDLYSASVVVAVYDALSTSEKRHTLMSFINIGKVVDIAMRVMNRHQEKAA